MATAKTRTTAIKKRTDILLNREDITAYLKTLGYDVPSDAEIVVPVPGGGDWSNTDLELSETIIKISYIKTL